MAVKVSSLCFITELIWAILLLELACVSVSNGKGVNINLKIWRLLLNFQLDKQLIIYIKIQGVSEVDAILAVVAVDPSAISATGKREKNFFFCGNFPPETQSKFAGFFCQVW